MAAGIATTKEYRSALERYALLHTRGRRLADDRELLALESEIAKYLLKTGGIAAAERQPTRSKLSPIKRQS